MLERIVETINRIFPYTSYESQRGDYNSASVMNPDFTHSDNHSYSSAVMTWDGNRFYHGNDIAEIYRRDSELNRVYSEFQDYSETLKPSLVNYLESKGKKLVDIVGIASANMKEGVVAAIQRTEKEGLLIANKNYANVITAFAYSHGLTYDEARQFVWDHELIHAANVDAEIDVFKTQFNYYTSMVETSENEERESYMRLATAAHARYMREENGKETN